MKEAGHSGISIHRDPLGRLIIRESGGREINIGKFIFCPYCGAELK